MWGFDEGVNFVNLLGDTENSLHGTAWGPATAETNWSDANLADEISAIIAAGRKLPSEFPVTGAKTTIVERSSSVSTGGDLAYVMATDLDDVVGTWNATTPTSVCFYLWVPFAGMFEYVDVGGMITDYDSEGSPDEPEWDDEAYTRNYISPSLSDAWVKIETTELSSGLHELVLYFKFGADVSDPYFYVHNMTLGHYAESYSNRSTGVSPDADITGTFYIKGVGIDEESAESDYGNLCQEIYAAGANTITLPIKVAMASTTATTVSLDTDDDSYKIAKLIYTNLKDTHRIILEPYPYINSGASPKDAVDPSAPATWIANWKDALVQIVEDMPMSWGVYVGTNFENLEAETDDWLALMNHMRAVFRGRIMYKTKWWITDISTPSTYTDYEDDKLNLGLWAGVDIIAISAFFEVSNLSAPDREDIVNALNSTTVDARGQDVAQEIANFWTTWEKPVLLGDLTAPNLEYGASEPWNDSVSGTPSTNVQRYLIEGYNEALSSTDGVIGFSVPYVGSTGVYELSDEAKEYALNDQETYGARTAPMLLLESEAKSALSQGGTQLKAYYTIRDNKLMAFQTGIPMVAGSDGYVKLRGSSSSDPSLLFDANGAFTRAGVRQRTTIEFWLRIHGASAENRKMFGPQENTDGLYVRGSTIVFVVGDTIASANIGRLSGPMLVNILWQLGNVQVFINGESVIKMDFDEEVLAHPANTNLAFYSYVDLGPIDVDNVSVFSYLLPQEVIKRRFVIGQGTAPLSVVNSAYDGVVAKPSFESSTCSKSISYPNNFNWGAGKFFNLEVQNNKLTTVNRPLPEINLADSTEAELMLAVDAVNTENDLFFTFRPDGIADFASSIGYLEFNRMSDYCQPLKAICVNWYTASATGEETIIYLTSKSDSSIYLRVYKDATNVKTEFVNGDSTTLLDTTAVSTDTRYNTVIDPSQRLFGSTEIPTALKHFFGNVSDMELRVGGENTTTGSSQFEGRIYSVSFFGPQLKAQADDYLTGHPVETIDYDGAPAEEKEALGKADYSLKVFREFGKFFLDAEQVGVWEDYVPLAVMAGFVDDEFGDRKMACDMIQFNIGYPRPATTDLEGPTYAEFLAEMLLLYPTYADFEAVYGSITYGDLYASLVSYSVEDYEVRAFISFESVYSAPSSLYNLNGVVKANSTYTVSFDNDTEYESGGPIALGDKIEVVEGTAIVPPRSLAIDEVSVGVYLEFRARSSVTRPVSVRSMELASFYFNKNRFTDIGSDTGKPVYVLSTDGAYYNLYVENPFSIDKRPYTPLYLTDVSGSGLLGLPTGLTERTMSTIVDDGVNDSDYAISCIQFWANTEDERITSAPGSKIIGFSDGTSEIILKVSEVIDNGEYLRLDLVDEDGDIYVPAVVFVNGLQVSTIVLRRSEWTAFAIYLDSPIDPTTTSPKINLYPGTRFDNVSYFPEPSTRVIPETRASGDIVDSLWTGYDPEDAWSSVIYQSRILPKKEALPSKLYALSTGVFETDVTPVIDASVSTLSISAGLVATQDNILLFTDSTSVEYTQESA